MGIGRITRVCRRAFLWMISCDFVDGGLITHQGIKTNENIDDTGIEISLLPCGGCHREMTFVFRQIVLRRDDLLMIWHQDVILNRQKDLVLAIENTRAFVLESFIGTNYLKVALRQVPSAGILQMLRDYEHLKDDSVLLSGQLLLKKPHNWR